MTRRSLIASSAFAPLLLGADEQEWRDFIAWFKKQQPNSGNVWQMYRSKLKEDGLPPAEVNRVIDALARKSQESDELSSLMFNRIYSGSTASFPTAPNAFLVECAAALKPGKALDIDMGQGRNAVYLAQKGWDVTGIDISEEGLEQARAAAKRAGAKLNAIRQAHEQFDYGTNQWDLVAMLYTWVGPAESGLLERIHESIKPGGVLVFENALFEDGAAAAAARNPGAVLPNQLLQVFRGLRVLRYEDRTAVADWSAGQSRIARLLAAKLA
jgi:SAM-dependent methyltransferase